MNSASGVGRALTDSKMATPLAPMLPLGVTPRPPINPAHRSLGAEKHFAGVLKNETSHLAPRLRFLNTTLRRREPGLLRETADPEHGEDAQVSPGRPAAPESKRWAAARGHSSEGPTPARSGRPGRQSDDGCGGPGPGDVRASQRRRTCTNKQACAPRGPPGPPPAHPPPPARPPLASSARLGKQTWCFSKTDRGRCTSSPARRSGLAGRPSHWGWPLRGLNRGVLRLRQVT